MSVCVSGQVSGLVCCECEREMEGVCLAVCAYVCVYLAVCICVYFGFLSLFDLRKLRGGKGREGRVSLSSGD